MSHIGVRIVVGGKFHTGALTGYYYVSVYRILGYVEYGCPFGRRISGFAPSIIDSYDIIRCVLKRAFMVKDYNGPVASHGIYDNLVFVFLMF